MLSLFQALMDQYFERIQQLLTRSDFPARIRFMIEDVVELRNSKVLRWCLACFSRGSLSIFFILFYLFPKFCFSPSLPRGHLLTSKIVWQGQLKEQ